MSLQPSIKAVLNIIQKAIRQTPKDKQQLLLNRLKIVLDKHQKSQTKEQNQSSYLRDLEFNLNFIRLSFPHLDFSPPIQEKSQKEEQKEKQEESKQQNLKRQYFELQNQAQVDKFMEKTFESMHNVREEVQFTNWTAGNVDPEDLRRHKELMTRQYFGGQFWQGKQLPRSYAAQMLQDAMEENPEMRHQRRVLDEDDFEEFEFEDDPDDRWQTIKR